MKRYQKRAVWCYCETTLLSKQKEKGFCGAEECEKRNSESCLHVMECGHRCLGILDEVEHLGCLQCEDGSSDSMSPASPSSSASSPSFAVAASSSSSSSSSSSFSYLVEISHKDFCSFFSFLISP